MPEMRRETSEATNKAAEAGRRGAEQASDTARRMTDEALEAGREGAAQAERLARQSTQSLEVASTASTAMASAMQDISREWIALVEDRLQKNLSGLNELARCRSWDDFMSIQRNLVQDNWQQMIAGFRRMAEIQINALDRASKTVTSAAEEGMERTRRAA